MILAKNQTMDQHIVKQLQKAKTNSYDIKCKLCTERQVWAVC